MLDCSSDYILTFDTDWAPDWVIDYVAHILIEKRVRATWFVTHQSEAIEKLKKSDLFELGIHPNLLSGSTHGNTEDEVLKHVLEFVPHAISMRTHGLYQSSNFLVKAAKEYGIAIDVSLFLPRMAYLCPHQLRWSNSRLWRIPYYWEDDSETFEENPIWKLSDRRLGMPGLKVFDFHPIHILLNTRSFGSYDELKKKLPLEDWDPEFVEQHANEGDGPKSLFLDLVGHLSGKGKWIKQIVNKGGMS